MDTVRYIPKFSKIIIYVFISLTTSSYSACCMEGFTETQYKTHLMEFQRDFGMKIEAEFGLKWIEGGIIPNYSRDEPSFYAYRRATLEEARALVLAVIFKLAAAVQSDPQMLSYLNESSLISNFLGVDIIFKPSRNEKYDDGSIDSVHSYYCRDDVNGTQKLQLRYDATDPFEDFSDYKSNSYWRMEESFEDAVKLNAVSTVVNPSFHNPKAFEDELNQILASFTEDMKKYGLYFRSIGWMKDGNSFSEISEIRAKCTYYYPSDLEESRALMLLTIEKLLYALNNSQSLKPYLKEYPFSADKIKLRMLFRKSKHLVGDAPYNDGSLESAVLRENSISYYYQKPMDIGPGEYERALYSSELLQEAKKTFETTPPLSLFQKALKELTHFLLDSIYSIKLLFIYLIFFVLFMIASGFGVLAVAIVLLFTIFRRYRLTRHRNIDPLPKK